MTASRIRGTGRLNPDGVIDRIDPRVPDDEALDDAADAAGGGPALVLERLFPGAVRLRTACRRHRTRLRLWAGVAGLPSRPGRPPTVHVDFPVGLGSAMSRDVKANAAAVIRMAGSHPVLSARV